MRQGLLILLWSMSVAYAISQAGIGITVPHASAMLDVTSTDKGFLPPRMTTAERNAIAAPAAGLTIFNTTVNCLQWFTGQAWYDGCTGQEMWAPGYVHCDPNNPTAIVDVTNPVTGKIWMDRNLGATQAATSSTDANSYGDLYQWGRGADGHQCRNSVNTALNATVNSDTPGHDDFIIVDESPLDWRSDNNNNRWNANPIVNNPCPIGYRVPSEAELDAERASWVQAPINSTNNAAGAIASSLKLPLPGRRIFNTGLLINFGNSGNYWSSTVSGTNAGALGFNGIDAFMYADNRATGLSVRCLKE